jgi:hypothetical protein
MKKLILICLFFPICVAAQEEKKVMEPIHQLFEAMKTGDSAAVRLAFHPEAVLFTVIKDQKTSQPALRKETLAAFVKSVGTPHKDVYNELIWGEKIFIDGDFAQVWVDYAFYLNTTFNHCGVDAFQLIRNAEGKWLIYGLSDTRRKVGCEVPTEVSGRLK